MKKFEYKKLDVLTTQKYIKLIKDKFERKLAKQLCLTRVSAPLFVTPQSGLQDELSGEERPVEFDIKKDGQTLQIVQSLAKWKRFALAKYKILPHKGIYTDMTAIRRDDKVDATHSIYVDQWDWEKVITTKDRTIEYLKQTVEKIVKAIISTQKAIAFRGFKTPHLCKKVHFITSQQLLELYPGTTDKEREYLITKKYKTVFIMQIGWPLSDGKPHDLRAPDYDDWTLDGDLLFYHQPLDIALELTSMGIRVDKPALEKQLEFSKQQHKLQYPYHKAILDHSLPLSIGGGIGQSRLCQLILGRKHVGEVQASYWDKETEDFCQKHQICLL